MSAVLQPLEVLIGKPLSISDGSNWTLATKNDAYFNSMVNNLPVLSLCYNVQCVRLAHNLSAARKQKAVDEAKAEELTLQIKDALVLAELLAHLHRYYIYVPSEASRLEKEQKLLRNLLRLRGINLPMPTKKTTEKPQEGESFIQTLKRIHRESNWPRLFSVRGRRVFFTMIPFFRDLGVNEYEQIFNFFDLFVGPVLSHLGYLFFIPRLAANIFMLLKHVIPGQWLPEEERRLSWVTRLKAQLQRRWPEIANDLAWMIGGLLNCYLLVGALAPIGMYVSISLFFYDVLVAGLRALIELKRLTKLLTKFEAALETPDLGKEERARIRDYITYLEARISIERKQLWLGIGITAGLFLAMCFAIPALAGTPALPFIGAILVLTVTLSNYLIGRWLDSQRANYRMEAIEKTGKRVFSNSRHIMFHQPGLSQGDQEPEEQDEMLYPEMRPSKSVPYLIPRDGKGLT